jgi:hypothetical protein
MSNGFFAESDRRYGNLYLNGKEELGNPNELRGYRL